LVDYRDIEGYKGINGDIVGFRWIPSLVQLPPSLVKKGRNLASWPLKILKIFACVAKKPSKYPPSLSNKRKLKRLVGGGLIELLINMHGKLSVTSPFLIFGFL